MRLELRKLGRRCAGLDRRAAEVRRSRGKPDSQVHSSPPTPVYISPNKNKDKKFRVLQSRKHTGAQLHPAPGRGKRKVAAAASSYARLTYTPPTWRTSGSSRCPRRSSPCRRRRRRRWRWPPASWRTACSGGPGRTRRAGGCPCRRRSPGPRRWRWMRRSRRRRSRGGVSGGRSRACSAGL